MTAGDGQDSLLSSSSAETDTDKDDEFTSPAMKRKELPKKQLVTKKVSLVADKHKESDRALTEILAASSVDQGVQLDDSTISVMSTNRKRQACTSAGYTIETNQQSIISDENYFVLQWDGKMLKGLHHTDKRTYCNYT